MLFVDNAALTAHTEATLQELISRLAHACTEFGLTISIKKTNVLGQDASPAPHISIGDCTPDAVEDSTHHNNAHHDSEVVIKVTGSVKWQTREWHGRSLTYICMLLASNESLHYDGHQTWLLTFLLVVGIFCAQTVGGSRSASAKLGLPELLTSSQLTGGTPLARNYHLISQCGAHVQITPVRGRRAINALASASTDYALLSIESHSPTELKILGVKAQKYLCFSRRGRLIARYNGNSKRCMFHEREKDGYIMLQSVAQPTWYVGFNRNGLSKRGYTIPRNNKKDASQGDGASVSKPLSRRRGRKRGNNRRGGKKRRHRHGISSRRRPPRGPPMLRGGVRDRSMCFQFTLRRTDRDMSDPRVQNSLTKLIHDPWKDTDVSNFLSTPPNPR
ncbi:hypothetical protein ACOMHN_029181 [Nucella lapillus]